MAKKSKSVCYLLAVFAAAGVGACTMADSSLLYENAQVGCRDGKGLGSYYLPKSYLGVEVWRARHKETLVDTYKLQVKGLISRADPSKLYCLDYQGALTAKDTVRVWKTNEGVLAKIASRADDQSALIIKKIIQTIFTLVIGLSPGPDVTAREDDDTTWERVFSAEYDPTALEEVAFLNQRLTDFGFCLVSQGDLQAHRLDPNRYCEHPNAYQGASLWSAKDDLAAEEIATANLRGEQQHGIFYRPRIPYQVFLFARKNRKIKGDWEFHRRAILDIENNAPIISVAVERTFFAKRATVMEFDEGVLANVHVYKTSELQEIVEIPLEIASQIVQLPTNIIRFRTGDVKNEEVLQRAQTALLQAQDDRLRQKTDRAQKYVNFGENTPLEGLIDTGSQ